MSPEAQKALTDIELMVSKAAESHDTEAFADALRFSGEELARFDNRWRKAHNARQSNVSDLQDLCALTVAHAQLLMEAEMDADALMVAVFAMTAVAMENKSTDMSTDMFQLSAIACQALDRMANKLNSADEYTATHFNAIVTYCASMLYHWYRATLEHGQTPLHAEVTPLLRTLIRGNAVQWPDVDVLGQKCSAASPAPILGDLLGHCRALGLAGDC